MDLDVQLDEEAAADSGYYYQQDMIFADPRDDEAPPVWGYRRGSCWSRMSVDNRILLIGTLAFSLVIALLTGTVYYDYARNLPSFSVRLIALHEGGSIDPAQPGRVVSPAFRVALRMTKACVDRADVVVAYAGVALGWARAEPMDCAVRRWARDVEVVARGDGVGLSGGLRDRMAAEWQSSGSLELDVDARVFDGSAGDFLFPQVVMSRKVRLELDGQGSESESLPLAWHSLSLFTDDYDYGG
ncbi:hypothetical protein PR202_gb29913 [Eleusine coracana subsp. coracana]|uniref:Uncharacterized protein n=1 Tax=Eleusine coracana subsp. coracana TaxID=191504 RepID=A0AAV5G0U4_ELECO|nr:hypothetical protein QOZ80_1BG0085150 [Eleusine coracana subsp. coracana]GJN40658.1 hypothetical protein PR202_gb29913 [Eleusine coracana subsp. coracana]